MPHPFQVKLCHTHSKSNCATPIPSQTMPHPFQVKTLSCHTHSIIPCHTHSMLNLIPCHTHSKLYLIPCHTHSKSNHATPIPSQTMPHPFQVKLCHTHSKSNHATPLTQHNLSSGHHGWFAPEHWATNGIVEPSGDDTKSDGGCHGNEPWPAQVDPTLVLRLDENAIQDLVEESVSAHGHDTEGDKQNTEQ